MPLDRLKYRRRIGTARHKDDGCAGGEWKGERIAEAISKENLRRREDDIVFVDTQDAATIGQVRVERIVLKMHDTFRPSC